MRPTLLAARFPRFLTADHIGGWRPQARARRREHDSAFAMTIHRSQGSEFASALLVLAEQTRRVLTRELVYTGITRAAQQLTPSSEMAIH